MPNVTLQRRKNKRRKPDEIFQHGPIVFERYGRFVRARNLAGPEYFEEIRAKTPEIVESLEKDIREAIIRLREILAPLHPIPFLFNAYGEYFLAHMGIEDEASLTEDHAIALRMIDYCSSIFAASALPESPRLHTPDEFEQVKDCIRKLFDRTKHYVFWSRAIDVTSTNDRKAQAQAELTTKLVLQWIFVRSDRHSFFELPHYKTLLTALDSLLKRTLSVDATGLLFGLEKILDNAQRGLAAAGAIVSKLHKDSTAHPDFAKVLSLPHDERQDALARLAGLDPTIVEDAIESFFGPRLFNVKKSTGWPPDLLDRLSYRPGEAAYFLSTEKPGWPTLIWPIFQRPFLKIDDNEIYCFDYISFFDRFYRQLLRLLRELDPKCVEEINRSQSSAVEATASSLLAAIIPGSKVYKNAYYRVAGEWFESDIIITYKDTLIAIEVRSGSLTPTSPDDDLPSYFRSIESLIVKPAMQAWRLLDAFANSPLEIFDSNKGSRNLLVILHASDFHFTIPMAVSLDQLHMMGAYFANTISAIDNHATRPTWVLSLDDLRCFEKIFESPSIFLHYAKKRMAAAAEIAVEAHDEMDHLGLYFRENDYIQQTKDFSGKVGRIGYSSDIDKYFFSLGAGEPIARPGQKLSEQIAQLVRAGDACANPLSRLLISLVLDGDDEFRNEISKWIDHQKINPVASERFRLCVFSFVEEMLSLVCANEWTEQTKQTGLDEAKARLLKAAKVHRMFLGYVIIKGNAIELIDCVQISKTDIPDPEKERLRAIGDAQLERDFAHVTGKIGRNDPCPCGSGLKYKKCCLRRREAKPLDQR